MSEDLRYTKDDFIKYILSSLESTTENEGAKEYLKAEGVDVDSFVAEGLKKIRKLELQLQAKKTKAEMISMEDLRQKATQWVEKLLQEKDFSFIEFVQREKLALQNSNFKEFSEEDIKNTLVQYFMLKYRESEER